MMRIICGENREECSSKKVYAAPPVINHRAVDKYIETETEDVEERDERDERERM